VGGADTKLHPLLLFKGK